MPISIVSNIASLRASRQLSRVTDSLGDTLARLSSGQRINTASDDAAGLAIAMSLQADTRIASVAIRNANDGISMVAIADGALDAVTSVLTRMAELAQQSANGIYQNRQRSALQNEFAALGSEIERIALTTKFNGINLLSGGASISLQVGFNSFSTSTILVQGVQGTLQSLFLAQTGSSALSYSVTANNEIDAQNAARTALAAVLTALDEVGSRRGSLGASESRLHTAVSHLSSSREAFQAAESRIRDVDVAAEAAELVRKSIVQQAAQAILAQANQQPAIALRLLGG